MRRNAKTMKSPVSKRKLRLAILALAVASATTVLGVSLAGAAKGGDSFIGVAGTPATGAGADGGAFNNPRDISVNQDTGQIFVVDSGNHRVQRFDAEGNFELAWGGDVSESDLSGDAGGVFEICAAAADCRAGATGGRGGIFNTPEGIAVDPDTGDVFVADAGNRRVQRFSFADGGTPVEPSDDLPVFESAWGSNAVQAGGTGGNTGPSERQRVELDFDLSDSATSVEGAFRLSFDGQTTEAISWPPTPEGIQSALDGLSNLAPGDTAVGPVTRAQGSTPGRFTYGWTVDFGGAYADMNVSSLVVDTAELVADGTISRSVVAVVEGDSNVEICTVASECQQAMVGQVAGAFGAGAFRLAVPDDGAAGAGRVFVTDPGNRRVSEFEVDGDFQRSWGYGVDSGAKAFEICTLASECAAGLALSIHLGGPNGQFRDGSPRDIAVDEAGIVYASDGPRMLRFDSTVADDAAAALLPDPLEGTAHGLEIDPSNGHLLVLGSAGGDTVVRELDTADEPPLEVDRHMQGSGSQPVNGLGVMHSEAGDELFVSASAGAIEHRVLVLDNDGAGPFTAALEPVSGIGVHGATLNGKVNANGPTVFAVRHNFQYSVDGVNWTTVPASDGPFSDGEDHAVTDTIGGLEGNTSYQVRLIGSRAFNGAFNEVTPAVTFQTLATFPAVETRQSSLRTDTGATLVGRLNPEGSPTDWHFEWGTDETYGNVTAVSTATGGKPRIVSARIEGLEPSTTYHYRLVATNGVEAEPGDAIVEGADVAVTTLAATPEAPGRSYEQVTPPFKATRSLAPFNSGPRANVNPGIPSLDGETIAWKTAFFPLSDDVDAIFSGDGRYSERTASGWVDHTINTLGVNRETSLPPNIRWGNTASSGDLKTLAVDLDGGVSADGSEQYSGVELDIPHEGTGYSPYYTRRDGTGLEGFTGWLDNPDTQMCIPMGFSAGCGDTGLRGDDALLNDAGTAMLRWGGYRGLAEDPATPADDDPSDDQQLTGGGFAATQGGATAYLQRASDPDELPSAPKVLVNECTGTGAGSTEVPRRASGAASSLIGTRDCEAGNVVSVRGASVRGGAQGEQVAASAQTALSNDGNRVFFHAPDPGTGPPHSCTTDTGADTNCPPQLYVRQHGPDGEEFVRWISRSRSEAVGDGSFSGAPIALQRFSQLDGGAVFQRASRDGRYVYFQTLSPLVPNDPNGGESITAGAASSDSSDLYRYELPADRAADPDGGKLLRITGGPTGAADPRASRWLSAGEVATSTRFISDDGSRAYFLTEEEISGADSARPSGGASDPDEPGRKLYLFDDNETGAERWKFIATIPYTTSTDDVDALSMCSTGFIAMGVQFGSHKGARRPNFSGNSGRNCFRGTRDAEHVIFHSNAPLTEDDGDDAADIFLYDAEADALIRVSAPENPAAVPYPCHGTPEVSGVSEVLGFCNAIPWEYGGSGGHWIETMIGGGEGMRGWNGFAYLNVSENPDGTVSVYFNSRSQLIAADVNEDFTDVYEWREGRLSLITPGKAKKDAWFSGNSVDGEDVFFITEQRIDPREIDDDLDLYNARVGGGFPYTPPPEPCDVLALECESEAAAPPPAPAAATVAAGGAGNVAAPKARRSACGKARLRRGKRCVPKRAIARKRCRQQRGKAKRRCVVKQLRRIAAAQKRQQRRAVRRRQGRNR